MSIVKKRARTPDSAELPEVITEFLSTCGEVALDAAHRAVSNRQKTLGAERECDRIQSTVADEGFAISLDCDAHEIKGLDGIELFLRVSLMTWDKEDMDIEHVKCTGLSCIKDQQRWVAELGFDGFDLDSEVGFDCDAVDLHGLGNWPRKRADWQFRDRDGPARYHGATVACRLYFPARYSGLAPGVYRVIREATGEIEKLTSFPGGKLDFEHGTPAAETRFFVLPVSGHEKYIQVFLSVEQTGRTITVDVPPSGTVSDIFDAVFEKEGIPVCQQRIVTRHKMVGYFGGLTSNEFVKGGDVTLKDAGITRETTCSFFLKCR